MSEQKQGLECPPSSPRLVVGKDQSAERQAAMWQDISTAPKDGTRFRARGRDYGQVDKGWHYVDAAWRDDGWNGAGFYNTEGSHFSYLTDWEPVKSSFPEEASQEADGGQSHV